MKEELIMKKYLFTIFITIILSISFLGKAFANSPTDCGLPSFVVDGSGVGAIANFVINISTSLPTYALGTTSGTLNCNGWTATELQEIYVQNTYEKLSEEASLGKGPHLEALAIMMGCPKNTHPQFGEIAHQHFQEFFLNLDSPQNQAKQLLKHLNIRLEQHPDIAQQCKIKQS